ENLTENARLVGEVLLSELAALQNKYPDFIGAVQGKGLVAGVHVVKPGGTEPYDALAFDVVGRAVEKGLLMFAPVGKAVVKIAPPLSITEDAVRDGIEALEEAFGEAVQASAEAPALKAEK
ncbi:MAG: aminotransferase class III-fold pyridoxal phosphate-dependent enzyme, partial [bacterium]